MNNESLNIFLRLVQEKHDQFRGFPGAFKAATKACIAAKEANLAVSLAVCVTPEYGTKANLESYLEMARKLGVCFVQFIEARSAGRYKDKSVSLSPEQITLDSIQRQQAIRDSIQAVLLHDILYDSFDEFLEKLAPQGEPYRHHGTGEDNGDAHIKRQLMGREVVVALTNGKLDFGPWEQIFYAEFDGQRKKRVLIKIIGT